MSVNSLRPLSRKGPKKGPKRGHFDPILGHSGPLSERVSGHFRQENGVLAARRTPERGPKRAQNGVSGTQIHAIHRVWIEEK